jgi:hypothetical protein
MTERLPLATELSVPSPAQPGLARVVFDPAQVGQARLAQGEGQGGGWPPAITSQSSTGIATTLLHLPRVIGNRKHWDLLPPLSPTLPHKGGGSDGSSRLLHRAIPSKKRRHSA